MNEVTESFNREPISYFKDVRIVDPFGEAKMSAKGEFIK